ncbi:MAG TPA: TIGR03621 family F420-dependent LLM class oxidoreductase [Ilumatobacteraceae bacterium]|nr:TIGR03621 family F420-dependent LLM class oxidoreductase [Ilumatobacteraceae bacterium]
MSTSPFPVRPFRFGVQLSAASDGPTWTETARRIESLGYAIATMPDHFTEQLAPMPALQAILCATTTLRAGALVFDNDYKHPAILAKELATMDVLSEGRVEIGLGAGWMISDYEQLGLPYDRAGVRIDRFVEGLAVIRGVMGPGPFSFSGEHYTVTAYDGLPKPVQAPCPPILIGGGGPRVLGIAAREADIVGVNGTLAAGFFGAEAFATMTADAVAEKVAVVVEQAGDRVEHIEMNIRTFFNSVTDDRAGTVDSIAQAIGVDPTALDSSPYALIGSPTKIVEDLRALRETYGFSYIIVGVNEIDSFAPVVAELAGN